jgi:hypothetical protein
MSKIWWYKHGNEKKKKELQHHLNVFFKKGH